MARLLFLHGSFGDNNDWQDAIQTLDHAPSRRHTDTQGTPSLAIDLPGHGNNASLANDSAYDQITRAAHAQIDRPTVVVGYSLGGRVALRLALALNAANDANLIGLVLEGANPGIDEPNARTQRRAQDETTAAAIETSAPHAFLDRWYQQGLFGPVARTPSQRAALVARRVPNFVPANAARIMRECSPGVVPSLWPKLGTLTVPTLYIAGADDHKYQAIGARFCHEAPRATLRVIPDAGHNTHVENPRAFADAVRAFVDYILSATHAP